MLDTMIDRQRQDLTEEEVGPLLSLMDKAEEKPGEWFNSPEKFESATNDAMMAQRKIIIEGVKNQRLRVVDVSQLRSAANFAAKSNDPQLALQLLLRADATMFQWSPSAKGQKLELLEEGMLARNGGTVGECVRTMSPLPKQGVHAIKVLYEYDGLQSAVATTGSGGYITGVLSAAYEADDIFGKQHGLRHCPAFWGLSEHEVIAAGQKVNQAVPADGSDDNKGSLFKPGDCLELV
eukprot:6998510-Prymnesium_polylepis.1